MVLNEQLLSYLCTAQMAFAEDFFPPLPLILFTCLSLLAQLAKKLLVHYWEGGDGACSGRGNGRRGSSQRPPAERVDSDALIRTDIG